MWELSIEPRTIDETVALLAQYGAEARIVNGGTDLLIEIERKMRSPRVLIDVSRVPELDEIAEDGEFIRLGAGVTHNQAVGSELLRRTAYPLVRSCWEVGAPQIRNRGTIAGNLVTASPANDTIVPLWALDAQIKLKSWRGERVLTFADFFKGVRQTAMQPDELLTEIIFQKLKSNQRGTFIKLGLRRAQAISVISAAVVLTFENETISDAKITLGAVTPVITNAADAERFLVGKDLSESNIIEAAKLATNAAKPIDDVRGTADYRVEMVRVCTARALRQIRDEKFDLPEKPVMLWGATDGRFQPTNEIGKHDANDRIETTVNGKAMFADGGADKSLLRFLREDLRLTGTKEGCAEGECGACTINLDGISVMSCLVPAARAHRARLETVEGLERDGELHPIQEKFIEHGAAQCGYCIPGFLMSGAKLLEEIPQPKKYDVEQAISGNLCRCTGYYKIIAAIEDAAGS